MASKSLDLIKKAVDSLGINPLKLASLVGDFKHSKKLMKRAIKEEIAEDKIAKLRKKNSLRLLKGATGTFGIDLPLGGTEEEFQKAMPGAVDQLAKRLGVDQTMAGKVFSSMKGAADEAFADGDGPRSIGDFLHTIATSAEDLAPGAGAALHGLADVVDKDDDDSSLDAELSKL